MPKECIDSPSIYPSPQSPAVFLVGWVLYGTFTTFCRGLSPATTLFYISCFLSYFRDWDKPLCLKNLFTLATFEPLSCYDYSCYDYLLGWVLDTFLETSLVGGLFFSPYLPHFSIHSTLPFICWLYLTTLPLHMTFYIYLYIHTFLSVLSGIPHLPGHTFPGHTLTGTRWRA